MDSDSDSNQSEEMFSDDELLTENYSHNPLNSDGSFIVSCSQSSIYNCSSAINQGSAAIPKTPLSLCPFISKAQVWTKDLETPELKKTTRKFVYSEETSDQADPPIINEKSMISNDMSLTYLNGPVIDEIIPASPPISMKDEKQRSNFRFHRYSSNKSTNNTSSKFNETDGIHDISGIIEKSYSNKYFNGTALCNSIRNSVRCSEISNDSCINIGTEQVNTLNCFTVAERVGQLKQLQEKHMKSIDDKYLSNKEFTRILTNLACEQKLNDNDKIKTKRLSQNQLEFIPFSQMSIKLDEENSNNLNENCIRSVQDDVYFHGFSKDCQDESRMNVMKFHNLFYEKNMLIHHEPLEYCNNFLGFTAHEAEHSRYVARNYKFTYDKYLDENCLLSKQRAINLIRSDGQNPSCISPLSLSVNTGIQTAHGDEIFIDVDIICKSKLLLLDGEKQLSTLSIDELFKSNNTRSCNYEEKTISSQCMTKNMKNSVLSDNAGLVDVEPECQDINPRHEDSHIIIPDRKTNQLIHSKNSTNVIDGFKTARGTSLGISEESLVRANKLFNEVNNMSLHESTDNVLAKPNLTSKNEEVSQAIPKILIKDSHGTISKATSSIQNKNDLFTSNLKVSSPLAGFQTGRGKSINITKSALLKAETAFANDINDDKFYDNACASFHNKENSIQVSNSVQNPTGYKRKHGADDDTPAGRKKIRFGTDLQRRKLFCEIEEEDNYIKESILLFNNEDSANCDRNIKSSLLKAKKLSDDITIDTKPSNNVNDISDEVRKSIAALLKDEEISNEASEQQPNNFSPNKKLLKNKRSDESYKYKFHKNIEQQSTSYSGSRDSIPNCNDESIDTKLTLNAKLLAEPLSPKYEDIPEDLYFDSQFSDDFVDSCAIEPNREKRSIAIIKQQALIDLKKTRRVQQAIEGSLLHLKSMNDRIRLMDLFKDGTLVTRTSKELINAKIDLSVLSIDAVTAIDYQFRCVDYFGQTYINDHYDGIPLGDNALLIPNNNNLAGVEEFKQSFLASPGVDPSLMPNGYIENHYRWIVWKLASMDRLKVNENIPSKFLTPDRVMRQLKYRYDREIDRAERPVLRRILERDDAPSRRFVLCVSQINVSDNDENVSLNKCHDRTIELIDGWYSIRAIIDYAMLDNIKCGKVKVGTKLMIYGAELLNLDEGCYPLDIPSNVRLKIHTNSTRRVKWYTKLGYQRHSGPMRVLLKSIKPKGGLIGKFTAAVARTYPIMYREKLGDGQFIDRNARCEEKIVIAHEAERQSRMEALYAKSEEYDGEKWKRQLENQEIQYFNADRDVIPIIKIKVADGDWAALVTLWAGKGESENVFNENTYITIYNALGSGKKFNELQITANRYTIFEKVSITDVAFTHIIYPKRIFTSLDYIYCSEFDPHYGEFDTVGMIVSIGPAPHGMKNFETVNLAFRNDCDEYASSFYLSILFWQGVSFYGLSEIVTVGSFIACSNLQWRKNTFKSIPTAYFTERSVITRNPKQSHLCQPFVNFRTRITDIGKYVTSCASIIEAETLKKSKLKLMPNGDSIQCTESHDISQLYMMECSSNKTTVDYSKSLVTPNRTSRDIAGPMTLKTRIDKLWNYGPAPTLSPIHLVRTPKISQDYRSPINHPSIKSMPRTK